MLQWYYLAIFASVFLGLATVLEKKVLKKEYASAFSATSALFIAIATLAFLPFLKLDISLQNWALIYAFSLIITASNILVARTFRHGTLSSTSPLNAILPVLFVVIFAYLFLHEVLTAVQYIGIGITIFATYLLLFDRNTKYNFGSSKYRYVILLNALILGAANIIFKYLLGITTPITFMVLSQVFVAINMVIYMNFKYGGLKEVLANSKVYTKELGLIVALNVAYLLSYYTAVAVAPISLASPLKNSLLVVITVLSGALVFKERNMAKKLLLSVLIILGACLLIL